MSEVPTPETPDKPAVPELLPFLTLSDVVVFPSMVVPLIVQGEREVKAIEHAALGQKLVGLFWRRQPGENVDPEAIGQTGTAAHIVRLMRLANGSVQLLLQGLARIQIQQLVHTDPYPVARVQSLADATGRSTALEGQARGALTLFQEVVNLAPYLPAEVGNTAANLPEPGVLADFIAVHLNLRLEERQEILDTLDVAERLRKVTEFLQREEDEVGVATGLAWTPAGGDVLFVEAVIVPGKGGLTLTGHLGAVMQESARAALTYARARARQLGIAPDFYRKYDVHIHVPAGAIPKDGPSAGITIATALISALTGRPVHKRVAMTGEITLSGRVLPIGGVKEKVLAAQRVGVHTVILPKANQVDLREVPESAREQLRFVFAEHMDEVLPVALHPADQSEWKPAAASG